MNEPRLPDAERLTALLRIVAVPVLLAGEVYVPKPEPSEGRFYVVLAVFALYAVVTLVAARFELAPGARWQRLAIADIAFAGLLTYSSGGGFSQLRFAFLFPVVVVAFRGRPLGTAAVAAGSTVVYVLQAAPHPSRSSSGALSFVLVQAAYLSWLGLALVLLSLLLARRDAAVRLLSDQRQRLVAEALTAEERERRQLAQELHDGAIQNLLAARHDLDLPARSAPGGPEARAHSAITATVAELRGAVADLHPYLLEQAGLAAAIGQAARAAAQRGGFALQLDVSDGEPGPNDRAVLRCTSELLANIVRHARATHVSVALQRGEEADRIRVRDDGVGFDPAVVSATVRAGHIGLASLRERAEALGGALSLESAPGTGTVATVTIPRA
ncbi:MAG: two-component system, NarL family, sensor kinase [Gaiellales bacterium]|nr:two-component system, NarL family, sensor kinase [Gaiellales bacterium]